jgi:hypothetical protein
MKTYWGSGDIVPRILNLGNRWRSVVSYTLQSLYPQRKSPWYPMNRRLSEPQSCSGNGGESPRAVLGTVVKRKISSPRWESKLRTLIVQSVAQRYTD